MLKSQNAPPQVDTFTTRTDTETIQPEYTLKNIQLAWEAPHNTPRFLHKKDESLDLRIVGTGFVEAVSQTKRSFPSSTASESRK